ncbi:helix-turn-helix domain-containing protein [Enterococcus durans]|uniref:helix-turn-helix domain-containing protein n=1 Tax=Enterococcus durans TaxID=53345 RepID=UPI001CD63A1E|nr:helix-turn-helix transcriptional regulator [Enterococcus durans]HJG22107.1 helix-turn-helix transcriptional regulator [Enterococcus durans]
MEFSEILKERRTSLGITQEGLAKELNVSRSAISNWEIGRNYPDIQTLIDLSKILDVSLDFLLNTDNTIVEKIDEDLSKKKWLKKISLVLATLLVIALSTIIFLFFTKTPTVNFIKSNEPVTSNITLFTKKDLKKISIKDKKVEVLFNLPKENTFAGYYTETDNKNGIVTIDMYKFINEGIREKKVLYNGLVDIDLSPYSHVREVNIRYH